MARETQTQIRVDLGASKEAWLDWCKAKGTTSSAVFRSVVIKLMSSQPAVAGVELDESAKKVTREIRLTPSELSRAEQIAAQAGFSFPRWVQSLVRAQVVDGPQFSRDELEALGRSNAELLRIGRNLNQIARHMNSVYGLQDDVKLDQLEELQAAIKSHTQLVGKLVQENVQRWRKR